MRILSKIQEWVRLRPRLKACLLPAYSRGLHMSWLVRKYILRSPVGFYVGQRHIRFHPAGHIPEILFKGDFEFAERDFVTTFLAPGMTVVDAGANIGLYSCIASVLVTQAGRVHAFEPGRVTFDRLQRNLRLNGCKNVVANRIALSDIKKQVVLSVDPSNPTLDSHCFVQANQSVNSLASSDEIVNSQRLDDYFAPFGWSGVDFLKIDVEGSELSLLQGAEKILTSSLKITILLECTKNREQVRDFLERKGFKCFVWDSSTRNLHPAIYSDVVSTSNVVFRRP